MSWSRFVCPHCHFNSRPSARGDLLRGKYAQGVHNFNSRPSARGDVLHVVYSFHSRYFNSRPSARGDPRLGKASGMHLISIHAPPRGATKSSKRIVCCRLFQFTPLREGRQLQQAQQQSTQAFQFTPLREGRHLSRWRTPFPISFQFTPLREGRRAWMGEEALEDLISIHAPPRGATRAQQPCYSSDVYFNSRPSARGDA